MALRPGAKPDTRTAPPRRALRRYGAVLLAVPALFLATSCSLLNGNSSSSDASASNSQNLEHPDISVGYMKVMDCAPFEIALQKGYFKQEGLNVKAVPVVSGTESVPKVAQGILDFGFSNWSTLMTAEANKTADFKIVADGSQGVAGDMAVTTWPGSGVNSIKDLVGKTLSTNASSDVPFLALKALMAADSIDISKVHIVIVHHPDTVQALATHQVDATIQLEPYMTKAAIQVGARPVVDLFGSGPAANLPLAGYFTTGSFAQKYPKTAAAFARAMAKGAADAANRKTVEGIIPALTGLDANTAALVHLPAYPTSLDAKRLQRVADLMQQYGLLPNHLDVSTMIVASPPTS